MRTVYVLPGLGGSTLGTNPQTTDDTWVNYSALARGLFGRLRLAADGVSPGGTDGVPLYPGGPLPNYYGLAIYQLRAALLGKGYTVVPFGYDWRLDLRTTGGQLASRIRADVLPGDPCTLIGHSLGGLVARMAWASLVGTGQSGLVRRIITLGTPHWGSYGAVRIWSQDSELQTQIFLLSLAAVGIDFPGNAYANGHIWSPERIAAVVATWPSVYWTLPSLLAPDATSDPNRAALYASDWTIGHFLDTTRLAAAKDVYQPLLASAPTMPPTSVMSTVRGGGFPTVGRLDRPQFLGMGKAYSNDTDGDEQVVASSSLLIGSAQLLINGAHGDLAVIASGVAGAADAILAERPDPAPPPLPVQIPGFYVRNLAGPPLATPGFSRDC